MKSFLLLTYLFILAGLVTNSDDSCDCCSKCPSSYQGSCPEIKYVEGGLSGLGVLSRYWNCCKPTCASVEEAAIGNAPKLCDANMRRLFDYSTKSKCEGGTATTCISHVPFLIDGCDDIGFAYGVLPSGIPNYCGKCFLLEFTGEGHWTTKDTHRALKGKKLIIMGIHKGYSDDKTFEILVPAGGAGMYEGHCDGIFDVDLGAKYGGYLIDCQGEAGMSDDVKSNTERKKCLIRKCTEGFTGQAREGCLFYAYFLEAAGNPDANYTEVECPQILKDNY